MFGDVKNKTEQRVLDHWERELQTDVARSDNLEELPGNVHVHLRCLDSLPGKGRHKGSKKEAARRRSLSVPLEV